jgi:hypothetical protein
MWKNAHEFMKRFKGEIASGSILCKDIVNVNWMDQNQLKEYRKGEKREYCKKLTGKTAKLIGEIIERAMAV